MTAGQSKKLSTDAMVRNAWGAGIGIPAFNIPHLPMMAPVVQALRDTKAFGLIQVARLEWIKFQAKSLKHIRDEYERVKDDDYTRLHLDHVPVIDEDQEGVDYLTIIQEALDLGFESVMVDGSRLSLEENIAATARVCELARRYGAATEGELGAVLGHEQGGLPPYEELFASGRGFTEPEEAARFVQETKVDWLSVAIGSFHGAISGAARLQKKLPARLNIEHLERLRVATQRPLVLHGGSGIPSETVREAVQHGIAKINIAATLRQAYEKLMDQSIEKAQQAVYEETRAIVAEELQVAGSARVRAR